MSGIVTFYSYKGGVGRSMALANIAVLLARRALKVLVVDWDLEAPGLERYFGDFEITPGGPGLMRMFIAASQGERVDFKEFTSFVHAEGMHPITFLASGRELDETYTQNLMAFNWEVFFAKNGGAFIEKLRDQWRDEFDIILIDSRTGLSDTGGICTIQLPDIVVAMFTANYQSLYGVRDVMRLAQIARQGLAYDRMPISVLPLPARWGVQEFEETRTWLDRVCEGMEEFYQDWLPQEYRARDLVERLKIPQIDYFGFGEKLAVVEQGTTDPQGMGFVYDKVASFLASDLKDLSGLMGEQAAKKEKKRRSRSPPVSYGQDALALAQDAHGYKYDIFVSHHPRTSEWALEFIERLTQELAPFREPQLFFDVQEVRVGGIGEFRRNEALLRSKVLLAIITPSYLESTYTRREFLTFRDRAIQTKTEVLVPLLLRGGWPDDFSEERGVDLRKYPAGKVTRSPLFNREIMKIAERLHHLLDRVPAFDPRWQRAVDDSGLAAGH